MNRLLETIKNYKIAIVVALLVALAGLIAVALLSNTRGKEYSNDYYSFLYDNTWRVNKAKENNIKLKHKSGSTINIEIIELTEKYKYATIEDIQDEFLYSVQKQNEGYNLIAKEEQKITKNEYEGFKLLYEDGNSQALVYVFKKADKIVVISFESDNKHFDILLDSVQNIVYNFNIADEKYEIPDNLKVDTTKINYPDNDSLKNIEEDTLTIANKNFYVEYSAPKGFEASELRTDGGMYYYTVSDTNKISLYSSIFNSNIYRYLDKEEKYNTIYTEIPDTIKNGEDESYSNFEEAIEEIKGDYPGYIYRATYTYKSTFGDSKKEKIFMIFALDKNHTLKLSIESTDVPITREFIEKIKIKSATNYSSFVKREVVDGNITASMKKYTDYNKESISEVTLIVPEIYTEQDKDYNMYEKRLFNKEHNEDTDVWNYEVKYTLTSKTKDIDSQLSLISLKYEKDYTDYMYMADVNLNGKTFKMYKGSYTDLTNTLFDRERFNVDARALFYEIDNGGYLVIEIYGNGVEISDEVLNEVTNFDIETKDIK